MSAEVFMVQIVISKMLSKITLCKLLVVLRVFLLLSVFVFDASLATEYCKRLMRVVSTSKFC